MRHPFVHLSREVIAEEPGVSMYITGRLPEYARAESTRRRNGISHVRTCAEKAKRDFLTYSYAIYVFCVLSATFRNNASG